MNLSKNNKIDKETQLEKLLAQNLSKPVIDKFTSDQERLRYKILPENDNMNNGINSWQGIS